MVRKTNDPDGITISGSSIGFTGLLTITFIVLKLCDVIDWNWFWVLSPLIFSVGLVIIALVVTIVLLLVTD